MGRGRARFPYPSRTLRIAALAAVGALWIGAPPTRAAEDEAARPDGTIVHLREVAERTLAQDRLRAVLRVEVRSASAQRVQDDINRAMAAGLERARAVPDVEVATEGYGLTFLEDAKRWLGWQALSLDAAGPDRLLALVGELQNQGFVVSSLDYYLSPEAAEAIRDELIVAAVRRLRERLDLLASTLGTPDVRLRELQIDDGGGPMPLQMKTMAFERAAADAVMPPSAEPGETRVSVQVAAEALLSD